MLASLRKALHAGLPTIGPVRSNYATPSSPLISVVAAGEELPVPLIDLVGFLLGSPESATEVVRLVGEACSSHGFFQVINHRIPSKLLADVHRSVESFFSMSLKEKQRAQRKSGESYGYASSFTGRFSSKLPWKETLSFRFSPRSTVVLEYFANNLGEDFRHFGLVGISEVYQDYCEAMSKLSLEIMEKPELTLGTGQASLRNCFGQAVIGGGGLIAGTPAWRASRSEASGISRREGRSGYGVVF
ncbi:Gibberellin 20 oxidase 1-D [Dendrobium catenatum]|uniref:Gibberellin 20 oxidase 1-D n=1 Tax=Dendrobium catenatum TaxID=906689 RepID=A0A2I0WDL1_9ASPA|nr:Gibberellin 20 oxidase 1-D [Dendrobium catenatum]